MTNRFPFTLSPAIDIADALVGHEEVLRPPVEFVGRTRKRAAALRLETQTARGRRLRKPERLERLDRQDLPAEVVHVEVVGAVPPHAHVAAHGAAGFHQLETMNAQARAFQLDVAGRRLERLAPRDALVEAHVPGAKHRPVLALQGQRRFADGPVHTPIIQAEGVPQVLPSASGSA